MINPLLVYAGIAGANYGWHFLNSAFFNSPKVQTDRAVTLQDHAADRRHEEADLAHQHRVAEGDLAHLHRLEEGDAQFERQVRLDAYHHQLQRALADDAARRQADTAAEIDLNRRFENAHPFFYEVGFTRTMLRDAYAMHRKPLLLVAPFWDEACIYTAATPADYGGVQQFRGTIARAWRRAAWKQDFHVIDGAFKRPLRQAECDIIVIHAALHDLPIVLVHGSLDEDVVSPAIVTWNVMPGEKIGQIVEIRGDDIKVADPAHLKNPMLCRAVGTHVAFMGGVLAQGYYHLLAQRPINRAAFLAEGMPEPMRAQIERWFGMIEAMAQRPLPSPAKAPKPALASLPGIADRTPSHPQGRAIAAPVAPRAAPRPVTITRPAIAQPAAPVRAEQSRSSAPVAPGRTADANMVALVDSVWNSLPRR